jgi:RNA polymerase sigma-70 factor (ECF subfamily)
VIRAHGPRIRLYLLALLREPDVADDAYSLWSEWVLRGIDGYRGEAPLRTWAYGVAHNAARRVRDDAFRRRRCSLSRAAASRLPHRASSSARQRERAAQVVEAIRARLTLDDQGLLALRIDHRLEWEAVAAILSPQPGETPTSAAAFRKRFERLKDRIRRLAREAGALE